MSHSGHSGVIWGIALICIGLLHLVFRRFYARRNAAIETAKRETSPFRRAWIWPTSVSSNLVWGTVISAILLLAGIAELATSL